MFLVILGYYEVLNTEQNVGNVITLVEYLQLLNLRCFSDQSVEMCQ